MRKKGNMLFYLRLRELGMLRLYMNHIIVISRPNFENNDWWYN